MDTYKKLKKLRQQIVLLPGLKTYKDFDIAVEIGHHELNGKPLTQKQLLLLNIASHATTRRHLDNLMRLGLVEKHQNQSDRRLSELKLSGRAHLLFDHCLVELESLLNDSVSAN